MDLDEFLRGQTSEGVGQGEGSFRIDKSEAARKLASFALPKRTSWVLKLVQAVVGWKCPILNIDRKRFELTFTFCPANLAEIPSLQDFFSTLVTGDLSLAQPLQRFCLALRALVQQNDYSFVLGLRHPGEESQSLFAGGFSSGLTENERTALVQTQEPGVRVHVSFFKSNEGRTGPLLGGILVGAPREQEVLQELRETAYLSPTAIVLADERIDGILGHHRWGFGRGQRPLELAGLTLHGVPALAGPDDLRASVIALSTSLSRARRGLGSHQQFPGWCVWVWETPRDNDTRAVRTGGIQVCWMQSGIVVDSAIHSTTAENLSALMLINAEDLECDLTGLILRETEARRARLREAWKDCYRVLGVRAHDLDPYLEPQTDQESLNDEKIERRKKSHKRCVMYPLFTLPMVLVATLNPLLGLGGTLVSMGLIVVSDFWPAEFQTRFGKKRFLKLCSGSLKCMRDFAKEELLARTVDSDEL